MLLNEVGSGETIAELRKGRLIVRKRPVWILTVAALFAITMLSSGCEGSWPPVGLDVRGYTDGEVSGFVVFVNNNGLSWVLNIDVRAGLHGNRLLGSAAGSVFPDANSQNPAKNYGDYIGWVNLEPIAPGASQGPFVYVVENTGEGPVTHAWMKFKTETTEGEVSTKVFRALPISEASQTIQDLFAREKANLLRN